MTVLAAPAKITLEQCRNGAATAENDCLALGGSSGWVNGNVGAQQGHLVEGYSIPYRALIENAPTGTSITVDLGYDIKHSGAHAIDFLTHYERLGGASHNGSFGHDAEDVVPTSGTGVAAAPVSEFAMPTPTTLKAGQPLARFNQLPAGERVMSLFGGTITNVAYLEQGDLDAAQSEARIRVTFTLSTANAVLAWGGHIARGPDWNGLSASAISGSPYHMRLKAWSIGNVGNQDRSLSADAVIAVPTAVTTALTEVGNASNTGATITVTVGASVIDSATLTGATADAGGTISYAVYSEGTCTTLLEDLTPTVNAVVNGAAPNSDAFATSTTGTFYFQAEYSGDALNLGATSACTDEVLTVSKASPSILTTPTPTSGSIGATLNDSAAVSGGFNPSGTVTFNLYGPDDVGCDGTALLTQERPLVAGVASTTGGFLTTAAGTYAWTAVYNGDANNNTATSGCTLEEVLIGKNSPTASTAQSLIPNDSFTLSGATSNASGTVDFYLFAPGVTCSEATVAMAAFSALNRPLVSNTTASTANTTFIASTQGTWKWFAIYEGDANNNPATSNCIETFTIDNDTSS